MAEPAETSKFDRITRIAIGLSVGWLVMVGLFFLILPPVRAPGVGFDSLRFVMVLIAIFMPLAMVWITVLIARDAGATKAEVSALTRRVDALTRMPAAQVMQEKPKQEPEKAAPVVKEAPQPANTSQPARTRFSSRREVSRLVVPQPAPQPSPQRDLPLATQGDAEDPPVDRRDVIRALNFPDDQNDTEGFAALRRALRDRPMRRLIQASQDVLTLLSQDGIYADDLHPDPTAPGLWRRFASGERHAAIGALGAVDDEEALAKVTERMRDDAIFRDTVHHFLRKFDQILASFSEEANDAEVLALAETRTARAFMLLGRATGTFG